MIRDATAWLALTLCAGSGVSCTAYGGTDYRLRLVAIDRFGGGDAAIAPDGRQFVISSRRTGNYELWRYEIDANRWTRLTRHDAEDFEAQWSPDGASLAFTSTRGGTKDIWTLSLADGRLTQLTTSPEEEEYPAWSPDGRWIVFTGGPWKHRDYFVIPAAGGTPRRVTRRSGQAGACSFSPDGDRLVCHGYDSGTGDLSLIAVGSGQVAPLTGDRAWDYKPVVAPGGWLAFSRSDEGPSRVWLRPLCGGVARPLVTTPYDDRWPTWSASGDRLLFHRFVDEGAGVRILDRGSGRVRTVVGSAERPLQASFDPSGDRIVYSALDDGRRVLRVRELKTGRAQTLDTGCCDGAYPRWSPDGSRIAFVRHDGRRWDVMTIEVDDGKLKEWTAGMDDLRGMDGPLDWSPDGTRIVFQADTNPFEADVFVLDTYDRSVRKLTDDAWFDEAPSWAPDGRSVLFMSTRGGNWTWGLFRMWLDGRVEGLAGPDYNEKNFPRASSDGRVVWSTTGSDGIERLAERAPDGTIRTLDRDALGRWPSYSRDGRQVLFTTVEHHVEYWLAENLFSRGSPLQATAASVWPADFSDGGAETLSPAGAQSYPIAASPKDLRHR